MLDYQFEEFWWESITGAHMVVERVSEALSSKKMVLLEIPSDLPFRSGMRNAIINNFHKNAVDEDPVFQFIDDSDDCCEEEPGNYLLMTFGKTREVKNGYRSGSKYSLQEYLIKNRVLHDCIIWVKGIKNNRASVWVEFCKRYKSESIKTGLFVLEVRESHEADKRIWEHIRFRDIVSRYDVQLFNSFILDNNVKLGPIWKQYISTVTARLCDFDAEVSAALIENTDFLNESPIKGLERIEQTGMFARRGSDEQSEHVLALLRNGAKQEIEKRIWTAQVQTLFPLIEIERTRIIQSNYGVLKNILDKHGIEQYGVELFDPEDIELGTLQNIVTYHGVSMSAKQKQRVQFLHERRNELAHISACDPEDVTVLIDEGAQW